MKIDGRFSTDFSVKDRTTGNQFRGNGYCYVTESTNLLGLEWCVQLLAYKELQEKYHCRMVRAWSTQGKEGEVVSRRCSTCFKKKRPIPYASIPKLDAEIDRLGSDGVISTVDHSEWAAPIVAVKKKNGQIR
ncbi:hypothetical protein TELCIR_15358 [Teladorsagia circumcincta]|uniref:Uncharacterized protein n=1 Tax=Teladorsagia circumcincta TaxID=45464 RepID=A0A2G9U039_TELCI|nr:hypothetical protein TELCIR_15358 [Teladorsagia circumcincta]